MLLPIDRQTGVWGSASAFMLFRGKSMFHRAFRGARPVVTTAAMPIFIVQNSAALPCGFTAAASADDPDHSMIWD
ncbi:hypothetical protein [Streptomyces sp. NPDC017993]|uniref:hypothetical protein n=1 Tax=Streptomyces sp. NPDC017993 TaxID=3365027 RepID=UPI00379A1A93